MSRRLPSLATADEVRRIARRALEALRECEFDPLEDDPEEVGPANVLSTAAVEALRFCAAAAEVLHDASLLPLLLEAYDELRNWDDFSSSNTGVVTTGIAGLLEGAPLDPQTRKLARHADADIRRGVAAGLALDDPKAVDLLETLAADASPEVRSCARERLSSLRPVVWWKGIFRADPAAGLKGKAKTRLEPLFARVAKLLEVSTFHAESVARELLEIVPELPDSAALELLEGVLASERYFPESTLAGLVAHLVGRAGGVDALLRIAVRWCDDEEHRLSRHAFAGMVAALPLDARRAICRAFLAHGFTLPLEIRIDVGQALPRELSGIVAKAWPAGDDPTPVLDAVLASEDPGEGEHDYYVSGLRALFERADLEVDEILPRVAEARLAKYPGRWRALAYGLDRLLERLPVAVLRPIAEQAARANDRDTAAWGLLLMLTRAYDPVRDLPLAEWLPRLLAEPCYRAVVVENIELRRRFLPGLRRELCAGTLAFQAAAGALKVVHELYGGLVDGVHGLFDAAPGDASRKKQRAEIAAFLGPVGLQVPITEEEWIAYRRVRGLHAMTQRQDWVAALEVLPPGPWHSEDRALLERGLAAWRSGQMGLELTLAVAIADKPTPADLPLLDQLLPPRGDPDDARMHRRVLRKARAALGLAAPPDSPDAEEATKTNPAPREWMDEEEDD